jgi:hypothetical protein
MSSLAQPTVSSSGVTPPAIPPVLPLWRIYTLRVCYLVLAGGLGAFYWPSILHHSAEFAATKGIQFGLLGGLGLAAVLGFRYPVKMVPLLLFELTWKAVYLVFFALPLWRAGRIPEAMEADISAVLMVVIFLPLDSVGACLAGVCDWAGRAVEIGLERGGRVWQRR